MTEVCRYQIVIGDMEEQSAPNIITEHIKPIMGVLVTILLFGGAGIGGYLVQQRQIFTPKAAQQEVSQAPQTSIALEGPTSVNVGDTFVVAVKARSDIDLVNLVTAKIKFPPDVLEVTSINSSNKIISTKSGCKKSNGRCGGDNDCCPGYLCQAFTGGAFKCVAESGHSVIKDGGASSLSAVSSPSSGLESNTASFIQTWVEKTYDNKLGLITLTGGIPSPGFKTSLGKTALMAEITFKVKGGGMPQLAFAPGTAIYRNTDNVNILDPRNEVNLAINILAPINESSASASVSASLRDMSVLLSNWDKTVSSASKVDLNKDGKINSLDYALMVIQLQKNGVIAPK